LQRNARDIAVAAQHYIVSERNYETYGQALIGLDDDGPASR
jgi:hypothetical protein